MKLFIVLFAITACFVVSDCATTVPVQTEDTTDDPKNFLDFFIEYLKQLIDEEQSSTTINYDGHSSAFTETPVVESVATTIRGTDETSTYVADITTEVLEKFDEEDRLAQKNHHQMGKQGNHKISRHHHDGHSKHHDDKHHNNNHHADKHHNNNHHADKHHADKHHADKHHAEKHHADKHHTGKHHADKHHSDKHHNDKHHADKQHAKGKHTEKQDKHHQQ